MIKSLIASTLVIFVLAGGFAIVTLVRAKFMGASAPHSCADGCASCTSHCENYNVDELKEEIKANINLNK